MIENVKDDSANNFKNLIQPMLSTFDECVSKNDLDAEKIIIACLEIMTNLVVKESILLVGILPKLVEYLTC
jgi:hypothetical protein